MKCPQCQRENPEDARFCNECACHLTEVTGLAAAALSSESERKHATIMFSDLSGYTAMSERLDPEEVREIMNLVFGEITRIIKSYDGFIEKFIGDAVMAVFGVPKSHEDDPVRAIRAAMDMHAVMEALNPQLENRIGNPLAMHTGINTGLIVTGEVDVGKGTHGLTGDAINLASRLQEMAKAGEILVGPDTRRQALNMFEFAALDPVEIKGKRKPVSLYKVHSAKKEAFKTHRLQGLQAALTGRDKEMAVLAGAIKRLNHGHGGVVAITGDAGTGKSRLKREFKQTLDRGKIQWLEGHAYSYTNNIPYYPLVDLLTHAFRIDDGDPPEAIRLKVEEGIALLLGRSNEYTPYIGSLFAFQYPEIENVSPEYWKDKLQASVAVVLAALAERRSTIVCFEDLHWADPSFLMLFQRLVRKALPKTLFVFTHRLPSAIFGGGPMAGGPERYQEIRLKDLAADEARDMLKSLLDSETIPERLHRFLEQKTQGNPYYLEEMANSLIERNILFSDGGRWSLSRDIGEADIPATIHGLLTARIDRLDRPSKRVLQEASVIGRSFLYRVLENITRAGGDVDGCLKGLESLNLIKTKSTEPELEYIFKHALMQDVVYNGLLKKERLEIHQRIGTAIERLFADRLIEFYEILSYHYEKSGSAKKAVYYFMKAGEKSLAKFALEEANHFFRKAYELIIGNRDKLEDWAKSLVELMNRWSLVLYYKSDFGSIYRIMSRHEDTAKQLDNLALAAMYHAWLGWSYLGIERYDESERYLLKALEIGEKIQDNKAVTYACTWYSWTLTTMGRFEEAIAFGERAARLARDFDLEPYLRFKSHAGIAQAYWYTGDRRKSLEEGQKLVAFGKAHGHIPALTFGYLELGASCLSDGNFTEALSWFERIVEEQKDFVYYHAALLLQGLTNFYIGEYERAENLIQKGLDYLEEDSRFPWLASPGQLYLGGVRLARGRMKEGMQIILKKREQLKQTGYKFFHAVAEYLLGNIYMRLAFRDADLSISTLLGNLGFLMGHFPFARARAERHLKQALYLADEIGAKGIKGQALLDLGRLNARKRRNKDARKYLAAAIDVFEACSIETFRNQAQTILDTLKPSRRC